MTDLQPIDASIVIVSFNTRDILRECLQSVYRETTGLTIEIILVDNDSKDGSYDMVASEFPDVHLIQSGANLGFGAANNLAIEHARGRYIVLLNSDAFLHPNALQLGLRHMDETPNCGLSGGLLVGRDGERQPSARTFHSLHGDMIVYTGLAGKYPKSKFFGDFDRTWADPYEAAEVDWVPGAFCIIRPEVLVKVGGLFDPIFFFYYDEVDLCLRIKKAGYTVWYWPDVVVTHIGGESSRTLKSLEFSSKAAQIVGWRMRSTLMYYRKHHGGLRAWMAKWMEIALYSAVAMKNRNSPDPERKEKAKRNETLARLMKQAWADTNGGRVSPPRPW